MHSGWEEGVVQDLGTKNEKFQRLFLLPRCYLLGEKQIGKGDQSLGMNSGWEEGVGQAYGTTKTPFQGLFLLHRYHLLA